MALNKNTMLAKVSRNILILHMVVVMLVNTDIVASKTVAPCSSLIAWKTRSEMTDDDSVHVVMLVGPLVSYKPVILAAPYLIE